MTNRSVKKMANNFNDNITRRKIRKGTSLEDVSKENSLLFETTILSLPNTSIEENTRITEIMGKLNKLEIDLLSANQEIENLNLENNRLEQELEKSAKIIEIYKKLHNTNTKNTPKNEKRKSFAVQLTSSSTPLKKTSEHKTTTKENQSNSNDMELPPAKRQDLHNTRPQETLIEEINNQANNEMNSNKIKSKIIILADQQGKNTQSTLQHLVGSEFSVISFWKPGAKLKDVLDAEKEFISGLTRNDFVVVLGATNDIDPYELQLHLNRFLYRTKNTNVLVCEVPYNPHLREKKLNSVFKLACKQFSHTTYIDMNYYAFYSKYYFTLNACRYILKDVLHIRYKLKYNEYCQHKQISTVNTNSNGDEQILIQQKNVNLLLLLLLFLLHKETNKGTTMVDKNLQTDCIETDNLSKENSENSSTSNFRF